MRLDKYLAQMAVGTRSEVKKIIRAGRVFVNHAPAIGPEQKVSETDNIMVDGQEIIYEKYQYYMLNKPAGYVSATRDGKDKTVVSLISEGDNDLFPVGRLDKDTEGLLLITNDGALAHNLLSPKKHVWKTYLVKADGLVTPEDVEKLEQGIDIGDEKKTLPARVKLKRYENAFGETVSPEESQIAQVMEKYRAGTGECTWLELSIREGRYHQVKRMMQAVGKPVLYLKRLSMGTLRLDENLEPGEYRKLTEEERKELI